MNSNKILGLKYVGTVRNFRYLLDVMPRKNQQITVLEYSRMLADMITGVAHYRQEGIFAYPLGQEDL